MIMKTGGILSATNMVHIFSKIKNFIFTFLINKPLIKTLVFLIFPFKIVLFYFPSGFFYFLLGEIFFKTLE
jgi:hypothetical protein